MKIALQVLGHLLLNLTIAFGPLVAALILNPYWHDGAVILANLWFLGVVIVATQRRAPVHYDSFLSWWRDRANWWVKWDGTKPQRHSCQWEHRADPGEEEHGKNPGKRYCKVCGREQWGFYHRFGNTRVTWMDVPAYEE